MKKIIINLLLFLLFASCGAKTENREQIINTAIKVDIDSLNPYKMKSTETNQIMYNVYEGLVVASEDGNVVPAISKSYNVSEDGKVYTFKIRDDVYFHNGDKLTVSDVVFSVNKMKELKLEKAFLNIEDVKAFNDEVIISLKDVDASFIYYLTKAIVQEKTYDTLDKKENGVGAYFVSKYEREHRLVLKSFDKYYGEKANIGEINIDISNNEDTTILNLLSGKYNFLYQVSTKRLVDIKDKQIITYPENMLFIMGINNKRFDKDVRAKLVSAINSDEVISKATESYAKKLKTKTIKLKEDDLKGLTLNFKIPSNYKIYVDAAQVIKEELESYGATVNIKAQEFATWLKEVYEDRDYDITLIGLSGKLDKDATFRRFVSDYSKNFINYNSSEYDNIIKEAKVTIAYSDRNKMYDKAYNILIEDYASAFIMDPAIAVVMDKNIKGFKTYTIPFIDFKTLKIGE